MKLDITKTERGFAIARFTDQYSTVCSIQESSLAETACIWLGDDVARMHLTQEMAAALIPALKRFVATGSIEGDRGPCTVAIHFASEGTSWAVLDADATIAALCPTEADADWVCEALNASERNLVIGREIPAEVTDGTS